jgi:hypothetical protein
LRKIRDINLAERYGLTELPIDWDNTVYYKNKDKAQRQAVKLNKFYQHQVQRINFLLADTYHISRQYWLFLSEFDAEQLRQRIHYIEYSLDAALAYQDQFYNSPTCIKRALVDLVSVIDTLLLYGHKRKDVPNIHQLDYLKEQAVYISNSKPVIHATSRNTKRLALRAIGSKV